MYVEDLKDVLDQMDDGSILIKDKLLCITSSEVIIFFDDRVDTMEVITNDSRIFRFDMNRNQWYGGLKYKI